VVITVSALYWPRTRKASATAAKARDMKAQGVRVSEIARLLSVPVSTVRRWVQQ
jgi:DNA invertase Pin-like site-specific DNA recombinase